MEITTKKEFYNYLENKYKKFLLNKQETASELNISQSTLNRSRLNGKIQSTKVGGSVMFSINAIVSFSEGE